MLGLPSNIETKSKPDLLNLAFLQNAKASEKSDAIDKKLFNFVRHLQQAVQNQRPETTKAQRSENGKENSKTDAPKREDIVDDLDKLKEKLEEVLKTPDLDPKTRIEIETAIQAIDKTEQDLLTPLLPILQAWVQNETPVTTNGISPDNTDSKENHEAKIDLTSLLEPQEIKQLKDLTQQLQTGELDKGATAFLEKLSGKLKEALLANPEIQADWKELPISQGEKTALLEKLEKVLAKLPPEAKEAVKDISIKIQADTAQISMQSKQPLEKSIRQLQLEAVLGKPKTIPNQAKPEQQADNDNFKPVLTNESTPDEETSDLFSQNKNSNETASQPNVVVPTTTGTDSNQVSFQSNLNNRLQIANVKPHEQVAEATRTLVQSGRKEITIDMKPIELGEVRVVLTTNAHKEVTARIITQTHEAKSQLENNVKDFISSLESQGINIQKVSISSNQTDTGEQSKSDQNPQNSFQSGHQDPRENGQAFAQAFQELQDSFKDGGSSLARGEASSNSAFDTDVEGEEVPLSATALPEESVINRETGEVNIRV